MRRYLETGRRSCDRGGVTEFLHPGGQPGQLMFQFENFPVLPRHDLVQVVNDVFLESQAAFQFVHALVGPAGHGLVI